MNRRHFLAAACGLPFFPRSLHAAEDLLKIRDFYDKGVIFSPLAQSLDGQRVRVEGFMAPPLKADSNFFVLTKMPMAVCPFCEPGGEWPRDILAIYTRRLYDVVAFNRRIIVEGELQLSDYIDPETSFFSKIRLEGASFDIA